MCGHTHKGHKLDVVSNSASLVLTKDIRVIRHTIATLDRLNGEAVPVKAVWDFDNLFSLQEILPQYAPDIIEDIRRRISDNGDEAILMSYNNGLVSAMNEQELTDAMNWAVSKPLEQRGQRCIRHLFPYRAAPRDDDDPRQFLDLQTVWHPGGGALLQCDAI